MTLHPPCIITSRLLPGIRIGNGTVSIEYHGMDDGRTCYRVFVDAPTLGADGTHEDTQLRSGVGGGSLQYGLASFLSFLSYELEHAQATRCSADPDDEPALFPPHVLDWASEYEMEIVDAAMQLEETPGLIQEYTS